MRNDPLLTLKKLIAERYQNALAIFWAGSVSNGQGTATSDLDLVIVYEKLPNAYREAFIYESWPIDAFIHDTETLCYFFEESRAGNGISGTVSMILNGRELTETSNFSKNIKTLAEDVFKAGPATWDKKQIDKERFLITDVLDDIKCPASKAEQIASAAWLFEALGQFYFRSQNKWCASGKSIIRYLKNDNPNLAAEFTRCFESLFQTGNSVDLESLVKKILEPYGGLFWDGFKSDAPKKSRIAEAYDEQNIKLLPATLQDYPTIQNMARFYVYDRTPYMGWECPENGLFECIDFKHYFETTGEDAFLIRVNNEIAGFVLLDKMHLLEPVDWNMGEFFVLAKFQRKGIASIVAKQIFKEHPGKWSVAVMPENIKAVKFWRKIISDVSKGKYTEVFKTENELRTTENPDPYAMNVFSFKA